MAKIPKRDCFCLQSCAGLTEATTVATAAGTTAAAGATTAAGTTTAGTTTAGTTTTTTTTTTADPSNVDDVNLADMTLYSSSNFDCDSTSATEVFLVNGTKNENSIRVRFNHGTGKTLIGESNGNKYVQVVRNSSNTYVQIEVSIGMDHDAPDSLGGSTHQVGMCQVRDIGTWDPKNGVRGFAFWFPFKPSLKKVSRLKHTPCQVVELAVKGNDQRYVACWLLYFAGPWILRESCV